MKNKQHLPMYLTEADVRKILFIISTACSNSAKTPMLSIEKAG